MGSTWARATGGVVINKNLSGRARSSMALLEGREPSKDQMGPLARFLHFLPAPNWLLLVGSNFLRRVHDGRVACVVVSEEWTEKSPPSQNQHILPHSFLQSAFCNHAILITVLWWLDPTLQGTR